MNSRSDKNRPKVERTDFIVGLMWQIAEGWKVVAAVTY